MPARGEVRKGPIWKRYGEEQAQFRRSVEGGRERRVLHCRCTDSKRFRAKSPATSSGLGGASRPARPIDDDRGTSTEADRQEERAGARAGTHRGMIRTAVPRPPPPNDVRIRSDARVIHGRPTRCTSPTRRIRTMAGSGGGRYTGRTRSKLGGWGKGGGRRARPARSGLHRRVPLEL